MGLIQTILGNKLRVYFKDFDTDGTIFAIDASVSEAHSRESPASQFEIESGTVISDNIVVKPMKLQLTGIISDTPLNLTGLLTTAIGVALPNPGVLVAAAGNLVGSSLISAIAGSQSPSQKAFAQLLMLQEAKNPFTVFTSLRSYPTMWIDSITVPRDPQSGQVLSFTANLIQLRIVSPQTVVTQIFQNPDLASYRADAGRQQNSRYPNQVLAGEKAGLSDVNTGARALGVGG